MGTQVVAGTYRRKRKPPQKVHTRARLLAYLRTFDSQHGRPPTETEMKAHLGVGNVHYHLVQLQKAGYLRLKRKRFWNIDLLDADGTVTNA